MKNTRGILIMLSMCVGFALAILLVIILLTGNTNRGVESSQFYLVDIEGLVLEVDAVDSEAALRGGLDKVPYGMLYAHLDDPQIFWVEVTPPGGRTRTIRYRVYENQSQGGGWFIVKSFY